MSGLADLPKTLTISEGELSIRSLQQGQREDTGRVLPPVLPWVWLCQSLCCRGKGSRSKISSAPKLLVCLMWKENEESQFNLKELMALLVALCQHFFSVIYSSTCIKCQTCRRWVNSFRIPLLNCFIFSYCCHSTILVSIPWVQQPAFMINSAFDIPLTSLENHISVIVFSRPSICGKHPGRAEGGMSMCGTSQLSSGAVANDV